MRLPLMPAVCKLKVVHFPHKKWCPSPCSCPYRDFYIEFLSLWRHVAHLNTQYNDTAHWQIPSLSKTKRILSPTFFSTDQTIYSAKHGKKHSGSFPIYHQPWYFWIMRVSWKMWVCVKMLKYSPDLLHRNAHSHIEPISEDLVWPSLQLIVRLPASNNSTITLLVSSCDQTKFK